MGIEILFFVLAALLIAVIIGHTIWSHRKEKSSVFSNTFSHRPPSTPVDNSGISAPESPTYTPSSPSVNDYDTAYQMPQEPHLGNPSYAYSAENSQEQIAHSVKSFNIRLAEEPSQPVVQPEPTVASQPASPQVSLRQPVAPQAVPSEPSSPLYQTIEDLERQGVDLNDDELRRQLAANSKVSYTADNRDTLVPQAPAAPTLEPKVEPKIISLYVVAPENQQFYGVHIAQQLEALGLRYGEQQIFHRHTSNEANSPVIFSVANMMQPGIFEVATIEQLYTMGVVFFMQVPNEGNVLANLRLLIGTAERLAQAMGGFVFDDQYRLFDESARQQYMARVQER